MTPARRVLNTQSPQDCYQNLPCAKAPYLRAGLLKAVMAAIQEERAQGW